MRVEARERDDQVFLLVFYTIVELIALCENKETDASS